MGRGGILLRRAGTFLGCCFTAAACGSGLLCAVAVGVAVRSHWTGDVLEYRCVDSADGDTVERKYQLGTGRGTFYLYLVDYRVPETYHRGRLVLFGAPGWSWTRQPPDGLPDTGPAVTFANRVGLFHFGGRRGAISRSATWCPLWPVARRRPAACRRPRTKSADPGERAAPHRADSTRRPEAQEDHTGGEGAAARAGMPPDRDPTGLNAYKDDPSQKANFIMDSPPSPPHTLQSSATL